MSRRAIILGAGVMGSAMVLPLRDRGWEVDLVGTHLDAAIIDSLRQSGLHPKLGTSLPGGTRYHTHEAFASLAADRTDLIVLGVASAGVPWAIEQLSGALRNAVPVVMITKGMHPDGNRLLPLPDIVAEQVKARASLDLPVAAIGGPCIAGELAVRRHTGTVIVSRDAGLAVRLCSALRTDYYHPRASTDMVGVEACAAFKNFFAIGVGAAKGAGETGPQPENRAFNNNAAALLFDQAIREMRLLVLALGGGEESVWGMPGAGDLYVTCQAGRNSRLGYQLGKGLLYRDVRSGPMQGETVEGAETGLAAADALRAMMSEGRLAAQQMPLTLALLAALEHNTPLSPPYAAMHGD